jgi:hypothetical protein
VAPACVWHCQGTTSCVPAGCVAWGWGSAGGWQHCVVGTLPELWAQACWLHCLLHRCRPGSYMRVGLRLPRHGPRHPCVGVGVMLPVAAAAVKQLPLQY